MSNGTGEFAALISTSKYALGKLNAVRFVSRRIAMTPTIKGDNAATRIKQRFDVACQLRSTAAPAVHQKHFRAVAPGKCHDAVVQPERHRFFQQFKFPGRALLSYGRAKYLRSHFYRIGFGH